MKAIILAAGRGSRMKNMTDDRPKCLLEVKGRTLIDWQLKALLEAGIQQIGIVTGYKRELLNQRGLKEFHNFRWPDTNMVSSLECANEWLKNDDCIVSYSDIFYDVSAVTTLILCQAALAITYDTQWLELWKKRFENPLIDAETFRLNSDQTLLEIGNKPTSLDQIQGQYMGLLKFTPTGWREVLKIRHQLPATEQDNMHMTGTLQKIITAGRLPIYAVPYSGIWGEVDSTEDLFNYK